MRVFVKRLLTPEGTWLVNAEVQIGFSEPPSDPEVEATPPYVVPDDITQAKAIMKKTVDAYTTLYIQRKLEEIDEDLTDLSSEIQYLTSLPERTAEQEERLQEILSIFAWKERVWEEEAKIEDEIDEIDALEDVYGFDVERVCRERYGGVA